MDAQTPSPLGPRFRFAPTPSRFLHVGNGLAALIGWAEARLAGGSFILRVEDIDTTRCRPEYEQACIDDMRWLGITWDEGPDVGGDFGPYNQSQRYERYNKTLARMAARGLTYFCVCSRADVMAAQRAPHGSAKLAQAYPGTCRHRNHRPTGQEERGGHRLLVDTLADSAIVTWNDGLQGPNSEDVRRSCGDYLLGRPNAPSYQLAAVVDDIEMQISHVVRGLDLLGSTARQCLLYDALGAARPTFIHHPLLIDSGGRKLSKRDADLSLQFYRREGLDAHRLIASLSYAIGLTERRYESLSPQDFLSAWALGREAAKNGVWTEAPEGYFNRGPET